MNPHYFFSITLPFRVRRGSSIYRNRAGKNRTALLNVALQLFIFFAVAVAETKQPRGIYRNRTAPKIFESIKSTTPFLAPISYHLF